MNFPQSPALSSEQGGGSGTLHLGQEDRLDTVVTGDRQDCAHVFCTWDTRSDNGVGTGDV